MDLQMSLAARMNLYRTFQLLLGGEPARERLDAVDASLAAQSAWILAQDLEAVASMSPTPEATEIPEFAYLEDAPVDVDGLVGGYTKLFVGPGAPAAEPWEALHTSVHRWLFNEVTLSVRRFYEANGVQPEMGRGVSDDHIALELGFLAELAARAYQPLAQEGETDVAGALPSATLVALDASGRFLDEHLLMWIGAFVSRVAHVEPSCASGDFYTRLAADLERFVRLDAAWLAAASRTYEGPEQGAEEGPEQGAEQGGVAAASLAKGA